MNVAERHLLADEVDVDFNVLHAPVLNWVRRQVDGTHIVAINHSSGGKGNEEFLEKLAQPAALSNDMGDGSVFGLGVGARDGRLSLRRPGDQIIAKIDAIAGSGPAGVRTACPVGQPAQSNTIGA